MRWIIEFRFKCNVAWLDKKRKENENSRMRESKLAHHEIDVAFMATRYFLPRMQFAKRAVAYNKKSDTARTSGVRGRH